MGLWKPLLGGYIAMPGGIIAHRRAYCRRVLGYRESQVLAYVRMALAQDGQSPSYDMIRSRLGLAHKGHVCEIVKQLERRGLMSRVGNGRARRIRLNLS